MIFRGLLLCGVVWLIWTYHDIQHAAEVSARENVQVNEAGLKRDIGYIWSERRRIDWGQQEKRIVWWVKVPSSNRLYSCEWDIGFNGFHRDDAVVLLHARDDDPDADTTTGLPDDLKGKIAEVNAVDEEELDDTASDDQN